jgi:uncharacterized protein YbjQ (UPF0145 family)
MCRHVRRFLLLLIVLAALPVGRSEATDQRHLLPIAAALETPEAKQKLDGSVKFIFGKSDQATAAGKLMRTQTSPGRTHTFGRPLEQVCNIAFVRAVERLQSIAKRVKANAVIDIVSTWHMNPVFSSATEYECYQGISVTTVNFRGDIVKFDE